MNGKSDPDKKHIAGKLIEIHVKFVIFDEFLWKNIIFGGEKITIFFLI